MPCHLPAPLLYPPLTPHKHVGPSVDPQAIWVTFDTLRKFVSIFIEGGRVCDTPHHPRGPEDVPAFTPGLKVARAWQLLVLPLALAVHVAVGELQPTLQAGSVRSPHPEVGVNRCHFFHTTPEGAQLYIGELPAIIRSVPEHRNKLPPSISQFRCRMLHDFLIRSLVNGGRKLDLYR